MTECNHLVGMSRMRVLDPKTGEAITSWLSEVRASQLPGLHWDGYKFDYCPECGADVRELVRHSMANLTFSGTGS